MRRRKCPPFTVKLTVQAAGPVRPRTRHKDHKILRGDGRIALPFVPYPGLYLTLERRPRKRGEPTQLYLRIRTVEWSLSEQEFSCVVDEMLGSNVFLETMEVREPPRIELHYARLERTLREFGFDVQTDITTFMALERYADGSFIEPPPPWQAQITHPRSRRRRGF